MGMLFQIRMRSVKNKTFRSSNLLKELETVNFMSTFAVFVAILYVLFSFKDQVLCHVSRFFAKSASHASVEM